MATNRKCRDCRYLIGEKTTIGIECLERHNQWKWGPKRPNSRYRTARYKYPSRPACKHFQPKPGGDYIGEL